jgi:hypothetical protein
MDGDNSGAGESAWTERIDFLVTVVMALAAVGTAWAGFQSTKWSGVQANAYAAAGAARTEANRLTIEATQLRTIDVISFTSWLNALNEEMIADPARRPSGRYEPDPATVSGFLFLRFRPEFRPAMDAWVATRPAVNPDAPPTPFAMPEYRLAAAEEADRQEVRAERLAGLARQANQRGDNYVLTAVIFALVLFFSGMANRARSRRSQLVLLVLAATAFVGSVIAQSLMPVQF